jgi:hypothetical protein
MVCIREDMPDALLLAIGSKRSFLAFLLAEPSCPANGGIRLNRYRLAVAG